jgi:hypothetical protein
MVWRRVWPLLAGLCIGGWAVGAAAEAWVQVSTYERIDGYLGDKRPEAGPYDNFEIYDPPSAKFYSVWDLELEPERVLMVEVYSYDFQPAVSVQDLQHNVLQRGTFQTPQWVQQYSAYLYKTILEFHTPWAGPAELLVSSQEISQGGFTITWSLWKASGAPATGDGGGGVTPFPDCGCQDLGSGRWFQVPIWELGNCDPATAIKWCN